MNVKIKRLSALFLVSVMVFGLTACGRGDRDDENKIPESTGGKDLARAELVDNVFSLNTNTNYSLNPFVATNHSNQLVCDLVYENMVEVDENFKAIPNVIGSWTTNDNATIWTLTLDSSKEHFFSDGIKTQYLSEQGHVFSLFDLQRHMKKRS